MRLLTVASQGTVASVGPHGVTLQLDVQSTNGRVYTVAGIVDEEVLTWGPVQDPTDILTVRHTYMGCLHRVILGFPSSTVPTGETWWTRWISPDSPSFIQSFALYADMVGSGVPGIDIPGLSSIR